MGDRLAEQFRRYIKDNELIKEGDKVLLAVSGGVDSMVMMSLFAEEPYETGVAHCNFQLRGRESYEDELLVEKAARDHGFPFYNMRFDTAGEMERTGESVQLAARRLRYDWFERLSRDNGYTVVAIAHHADDSTETFFINLFRGTGLKGLTGISVARGRIVRPLLFAARKDIMDYAAARKVPFREDSSNRSTKYLRNKIRLGLVPRMKEISPNFAWMMSTNVERLTQAQAFIDRGIELIRAEAETIEDGIIIIDPAKIDPDFPEGFVLYELLNKYGFKGDVVDSLHKSLQGGNTGRRFYSRDHAAYVDRGRIVVGPIPGGDSCTVIVDKDTERAYCGNSVLYFHQVDIDSVETLNQPAHVALLDADKLLFPLRLRRWAEGDSFIPLGMNGRKKVSDYLIDEKVSMAEKERQFVVVSGEDIVWLAGRRIDDRYKVTGSTENVLRIIKEIV